MGIIDYTELAAGIRRAAHPLSGAASDLDPLMDLVGDASIVLLGEETHGTHEFYRARSEITQRLILEKGFSAVAVEADWPDAYRVNRFVHGRGTDRSAEQALEVFQRFPLWMWRNTDVRDLVGWLRRHNDGLDESARVGFYGLDLYSLYNSVAAIIEYLDRVDPAAAEQARERYGCLEHRSREPQAYGYGVHFGTRASCEDEVVGQLLALRASRDAYVGRDGYVAQDEQFAAEQNARLVKNAEHYYRSMFAYDVSAWNLRDQHMADTLEALRAHLDRQGRPPKLIVWEHNSHIGDASATEMSRRGEHNVGQLVRKRYGDACRLIGFSTYSGTVTAASDWDGPAERKRVRPGLRGSVEDLMHSAGMPRFFLPLRGSELAAPLRQDLLERAIGVIYLPQSERASHYFHARLSEQFDGLIHFDHTRALEPLDPTSEWEQGEAPDTYPSGM